MNVLHRKATAAELEHQSVSAIGCLIEPIDRQSGSSNINRKISVLEAALQLTECSTRRQRWGSYNRRFIIEF